jgi:hypothetical protein
MNRSRPFCGAALRHVQEALGRRLRGGPRIPTLALEVAAFPAVAGRLIRAWERDTRFGAGSAVLLYSGSGHRKPVPDHL